MAGERPPHDATSQAELTAIFNEKVVTAEKMERPLGSSGGGSGSTFGISHQGVRVTTDQGNEYLIHKGDSYGLSNQTVVTEGRHMSDAWQSKGSVDVGATKSVGDLVKASGEGYNVFTDNCIQATKNMMKEAGN